ncbi:hypothetical protein R8Z50_22365 [Longispora sp. K20-0274]|uniref:hypothetical protein n=1 Tax=Longispora sp. K20-0274 TaxID=3088255 RepID=UPI00399B4595
MTEVELADAVNDTTEYLTGKPGRMTDRQVRRLLTGEVRWPWPATRAALEAVLGQSCVELGFLPSARANRAPGGILRLEGPRGEDIMERRELLGVAGGIAVSLMIPALPKRGRLGLSDVERLRKPLEDLLAIDERIGGVRLAEAAARQAQRIADAINRYDLADRVERACYSLRGEYLATAGWLAVDADDLDTAGDYLSEALEAASISGDPLLQAQVYNYMAMRSRQLRKYPDAHAIAKAGLKGAASRANPRVNALFHLRVAHGHGLRGEQGLARRSLQRAEDAFGRINPLTPVPAWLAFVDRQQVLALTAMTFNSLGDYTAARGHAQSNFDQIPTTRIRGRAHGALHLVKAHLGADDVPAALEHARIALPLAQQLREGLTTGRVARRMGHLRRILGQFHLREAQNWCATYDQAIAA